MSDPLLRDILTRARSAQLGSIVRTIQAKQDEIIRTVDDVTVVQGAAGTGKIVVALHRLAYLLYQSRVAADTDNEDFQEGYAVTRRRTSPRSTSGLQLAVFGPSRTYLRHIRSVLPALGENDIVQTTFEEWALGSLVDDRPPGISAADDLERLLDPSVPPRYVSACFDDREERAPSRWLGF
jgi:DNA helicase II / ATP-dependent DNA helicase PcrA